MTSRITGFEPEYLRQLVPIIEAQRRRLEETDPRLPRGGTVDAVAQQLHQQLAWPAAFGCLAEDDEGPRAFMVATPVTHEPDSWAANFFPPLYALFAAFAQDEAACESELHRLYAAAAEAMVSAGCGVHCVSVMAADAVAGELWWQLGFGCVNDHAMAPLGELPSAPAAVNRLAIRRSRAEDAPRIRSLVRGWSEWHARSPVFLPRRPAALPALYANLEREIEDPAYAHFLAELDGRLVGLCDGSWTARQASLAATVGHTPYADLRTLFVVSDATGRGIGRALCGAFYDWLRAESGAPYVYLQHFTANPASRAFWRAQGYRALSHWLQRVVPGVG